MKEWAIDFLRCPSTGSKLRIVNPKYQENHIIDGQLIS